MALDPVLNFAKVDVDGGFAAAATAITLIAGEGAKLPQPSTDGAFNITWWDESVFSDPSDDPNVEIVRVTARVTDVLTVTRAQEGTADTSKNTGGSTYKMVLSPTKKLPNDIQTQIQSGELVYAEDAGSNDTYVITLDPDPGVLTTGMVIAFKANTVNTGNATLNVNGLGAKNITKNVDQTLADGDIKADQRVVVIYNGVEFEMISQLGNVTAGGNKLGSTKLGAAATTMTLSGLAAKDTMRFVIGIPGDLSGSDRIAIRFNNDSGATQYRYSIARIQSASIQGASSNGASEGHIKERNDTTSGVWEIIVTNLASEIKKYAVNGTAQIDAGDTMYHQFGAGHWKNTADQITRIDVITVGGSVTMPVGSYIIAYGDNA